MEKIIEKALTPIYAAIDDGQYDKAIRLCGRKEIEKYDITKALLAYALQKTRQNSEALRVCRQVLVRKPTQERVVSTLALTLQALRADDDLRSMFEHFYETDPSEANAISLFLCYTRLG